MKDKFIKAIHDMSKIQLTFISVDDSSQKTRICAPMDFGPSRKAKDQSDRYHFWDYSSDTKPHSMSILPSNIVGIELLQEKFDPSEFVTWDTHKSPWFVTRNWGTKS